MPKKQNSPGATDLKKKNEKKELEELELAALLKQSLKKSKEESIENEVEDFGSGEKPDSDLDLRSLEFHQFMHGWDSEANTPVLERIAGTQVPRPIFVGGIPQGPANTGNGRESGDDFKYVSGLEQSNEPKYLGPPEAVRGSGERIRFEDVGRNGKFFPQTNQANLFEGASEAKSFGQPQSFERFERAERFDVEKAGRNQFERPEAKYEKYRPKLPSSK